MESNNFTHPILFVEDNPVDIDLTIRAFSKRNLANPLQIARDGEEALGWLEKWEAGAPLPVVILMDLKLPRVHGLDVLRAIKSNKRYKKIPIVILTTSSDDDDIKTAYDLGANSYIIKPVDFDKFLEVAAQIELYWNVVNKPFLDRTAPT
jgi:CheY-like chemotaxis protein